MVERLLGRKKDPEATPAATPAAEPEKSAPAPPAKPKTAVVATNTPAPAPAPKPPVRVIAPSPVAAAPEPADPEVGKVVDREFLWPEDPVVVEGGAQILKPTLAAPGG
ncbi:MAG: hypothetical protein RLO48_01360 [Bauldia litoralis]